jgi:hypothetical protein
MKKWFWIVLVFAMPVAAQAEVCEAYIQAMLANLSTVCREVTLNQVCLANASVTLDGAAPPFDRVGVVVSLDGVASMTLAPLQPERSAWGVAVIGIDGGRMVLFGGASYTPDTGALTLEGASACEQVTPHVLIQADETSTVTLAGDTFTAEGSVSMVLTEDGWTALLLAEDSTIEADAGATLDVVTDPATSIGEPLARALRGSTSENLNSAVVFPVTPADAIRPNDGAWEMVESRGYLYFYDAECAASEGPDGSPIAGDGTLTTFAWPDEITLPDFVAQRRGAPMSQQVLDQTVFIQPAANIYRALYTPTSLSPRPPIEASLYIVSPTEMVSSTLSWVVFDGFGGYLPCGVIIFEYWQYRG